VLVALLLRPEGTLARHAPSVLLRPLQVHIQLHLAVEAEQTSQAREPMIDMVVVFEVVLEAPLVLESAEAQIAEDVVTAGVVDVVLEPVAILEDADTEVAVVDVVSVWSLLHMALQCNLSRELEFAYAAPVLTGVEWLVTDYGGARVGACTLLRVSIPTRKWFWAVLDDQCSRWGCNCWRWRVASLLNALPWQRVVCNLVQKRILGGIFRWRGLWKIQVALAERRIPVGVLDNHCCSCVWAAVVG
jgi:hypothetical protein